MQRTYYRLALTGLLVLVFLANVAVLAQTVGTTLTPTITDTQRARAIPLKIYLPAQTAPAPVILFSHGLGGSRDGYTYLGQYWSAHGYVVVMMQHAGSDESIWKGKGPLAGLRAMRQAASGENLVARVNDVHAVIDALTGMNTDPASPLANRLDLGHIGMAGHSFGAVTSQAVTGQTYAGGGISSDPRIAAAVMLSPSPPKAGSAATAFAHVTRPWLLVTGTKDNAPVGGITAADRLDVFPNLPAGDKYLLVLDGAVHSDFSDRAKGPAGTHAHDAVTNLSLRFWDAYLKGDTAAKAALQDTRPANLAPADTWQTK